MTVPVTLIEMRARKGKRTVDCKIVRRWISPFSGWASLPMIKRWGLRLLAARNIGPLLAVWYEELERR